MKKKSCAIISHRPTRFKWKYKENYAGCKRLKKRLHDQFVMLYEHGVRRFYVGGGLGVDLWAGEILLDMKKQPEYAELELVVVIPFPGHDDAWEGPTRRRFSFLKDHSQVVLASSEIGAEGYRRRNFYLVDHADCMVAVFDGDQSIRSGIGQTVLQAERKGIPVILIHPDSGKVTLPNNDNVRSIHDQE